MKDKMSKDSSVLSNYTKELIEGTETTKHWKVNFPIIRRK